MKTEMLSLLSPKAIDLINPGGGFARVTPQDIAAALSGLKKAPYYLGMCVYVADGSCLMPLYVEVCGMKAIPKKPADMKGLRPVESILLLCLDELWGNNKCRACEGTGNTHEQQLCPVCQGRRFKQHTDLSRSRQANIPWNHWNRYKGFYSRLFTQLTDWDAQVRTHLAKRLS